MARKKAAASEALALERVEPLIHEIRGEKVILDSDLARLYGATTKRLNEQVKRNRERFPDDFMFRLTARESAALRSQFATSSSQASNQGDARSRSQIATLKRGENIKYLPYAFTEHGAIMAAKCPEQPARRADERLCRPRLSKNARIAGGQTRAGQTTRRAGKGTQAATRHSRSRHRHDPSARHGHHRSAGRAADAGKTEDRI